MNDLAARFPGLQASLPVIPLTDLPTPLRRATKFAGELGIEDVWIKRDDLAARIYGGNKVRKLEYLLADAESRGCDAVVTFGAVGSNHALATAIYAGQRGLACYAVLTDQPSTPKVGETLRYHARVGTKLVHVDGFQNSIRAAEEICADHPGGAKRVYWITWGGSSWLGSVGFVNAALEWSTQLEGQTIPERLYVACGTMGTAAGLALGLRLAELPTRVIAVQVVPAPVSSTDRFESLFSEMNRELHAREKGFPIFDEPLKNVDFRREFLGAGYAEPTPECTEALQLIADTENLWLDGTYTGKALAALIHDARNGVLARGSASFWNTYNARPYPADLSSIPPTAFADPFRNYVENSGHAGDDI